MDVELKNGSCKILIETDGTVHVGKGELADGTLLPENLINSAKEIVFGEDGMVLLPENADHLLAGMENLKRVDFRSASGMSTRSALGMFSGSIRLEEVDLRYIGFERLESMSDMFSWSGIRKIVLPEMPVRPALAVNLFGGCTLLEEIMNLDKIDLSRAWLTSSMFRHCASLRSVDGVEKWDMSSIGSAVSMFEGCGSLESIPCGEWDTGRLSNGSRMFDGCTSATDIPVGKWDTRSLRDASHMFAGCRSLRQLETAGWDVPNLQDASRMFYGCSRLESIAFDGWDPIALSGVDEMLDGCGMLRYVTGIERIAPEEPRGAVADLRRPARVVEAVVRSGGAR